MTRSESGSPNDKRSAHAKRRTLAEGVDWRRIGIQPIVRASLRKAGCSTRARRGQSESRAWSLPAGLVENLVAAHMTKATADNRLDVDIDQSLRARTGTQPAPLAAVRADLPGRVASGWGAASTFTDEQGVLDGGARELVEAKLRAETDRLVAAERQLAETVRDRLDLEFADREAEWGAAYRNFARVRKLMTPENQGRLLRALVAAVRVKEETGVVEVELVNFAADAGSKEAA